MKMLNTSWPILLAIAVSGLAACACSVTHDGPISDHYDGSVFFNKEPDHSFTDMVKWLWEMETETWPEWIEDPKQPPPMKNVKMGELRVTFINHATVLIQMDGINILTDPIWSFRASPVTWAGPKRVRAPGVSLDDLPKIHYILISHDHYDHLDLPTLKRIELSHHPKILAGLGVKSLFLTHKINKVVEMDWWQAHLIEDGDLTITFVPARHNSGRWPFMKNKTLWGGFVIDGPNGQVYFAGDTAFGAFLDAIAEKFQQIRLAILPIGSYEKRWFMKTQHMNPEDAVLAHKILNAQQSLGVHFGTFAEHPEQTIDAHEKDLSEALEKHKLPSSRFWVLKFGEGKMCRSWEK